MRIRTKRNIRKLGGGRILALKRARHNRRSIKSFVRDSWFRLHGAKGVTRHLRERFPGVSWKFVTSSKPSDRLTNNHRNQNGIRWVVNVPGMGRGAPHVLLCGRVK